MDQAARLQAREEAMRLKEDFLSSAAHDLKTPLTGMVTQTQLLQRRAQRDPRAPPDPTSIERLLREARRLKAAGLELLDAAQLEHTSSVPLMRENVDLAALVRDVCATRPRCRPKAPDVLLGTFDSARLRRLLEHLVDNALTYDPSGAEVLVELRREGDQARLSVTDRGIGILPGDMSQLFQRFHRGRNVDDRRYAGLGLGLYVCRQIVEQHGGRIWADSRSGQGSTFHVELPLVAAASKNDHQSSLAGASNDDQPFGHRLGSHA
jgi:signal transduction histidine kinase